MRKGFNLIELLIAIAIVSIIASIALPNLLKVRIAGSEAQAIGAMKTIETSQAMFRDGDLDEDDFLDYGTLTDLETENLIESVLGSGTKEGYDYDIPEATVDVWTGIAAPHSPISGKHHFYDNQNRRIYRGLCGNGVMEHGEECDPGSYESSWVCGLGWYCSRSCSCASLNVDNDDVQPNLPSGPNSQLAAQSAALTRLDNQGQDLVAALLSLSPGATTVPAIELLQSRKSVEKILKLIDANGDGKLSFEELTGADVVGIAQQLAGDLDIQAPDLQVDENKARALIQSYQQGVQQAILPGMTPDEELPRLPINGLRSSVNADMLKLFPPGDVIDPQQVN